MPFLDLDIGSAIGSCNFFEVIYLDGFWRYIFELHVHVLRANHRGVEIKIFEIDCAVAGTLG